MLFHAKVLVSNSFNVVCLTVGYPSWIDRSIAHHPAVEHRRVEQAHLSAEGEIAKATVTHRTHLICGSADIDAVTFNLL
jgi:hypothetical protein